MSRMFDEVTRTWNPVPGCRHGCIYCWAHHLVLERLRDSPHYRNGFEPQLIEAELGRRFKRGTIFVDDMGDLWGAWVPREWIERVLDVVRDSPEATFLMLTKNPERYLEFLEIMPPNVTLGATIETNRRWELVSQAPPVWDRIRALSRIPGSFRRLVSIEPIMDFDTEVFVEGLRLVHPSVVYVGYDSHHHSLPEPSRAKTGQLIAALREFTEVREKTLRRAWWEQ